MQIKEMQKKKNASLTTNHKQKTPQSESFRVVWFDRILFHTAASVSLCACVRVCSCSAASPERKSDLAPREIPSRTGIKEQPNWSQCTVFLLHPYSFTQMCTHTHTCRAHIHTCPTALIFVLSSPQNSFVQSWSESERIRFTCPQVSGVQADVSLCVILNRALPVLLFKSLKGEREYTHSQGLDVGRCNWYCLVVRHYSTLSSSILSSATLVVKDSNRWNALLSCKCQTKQAFTVAGWGDPLHLQSAGAAERHTCKHHHASIWKNRLQLEIQYRLETPPKPTNKCD